MPPPELGPSLIAWWGAGLSTLLALIKLWELWRNRFQFEVSYNFAGDPEIGNKVLIRNLSSQSFLLTHWELCYCKGYWPFRTFQEIESADHDATDRKVEPQSTLILTFSEATHFDWGTKALNGRRIFIRIWFAGRRPAYRKVYAQ